MRHGLLYLCLSITTLIILAASGCGNDERARIAILNDTSTHTSVITILQDAGYEVTDLGYYRDYTGTDFSAYDLVIFLTGAKWSSVLPESVQQGLLDFIAGGGTLVTTEWMGYSGRHNLLAAIMPLTYANDYCDEGDGKCIDTITVDVSHELTKGLPASFSTPPDYTYSLMSINTSSQATNVISVMSGTASGSALGVGDWGQGHFIHWNWAGVYGGEDIWDANTTKILLNIADFAR